MGRLTSYADSSYWNEPAWVCDGPDELNDCYWQDQWQVSQLRQESYNYDAVGNRRGIADSVALGNRLIRLNGYTMQYDADGNLLSKSGNGISMTLTWNGLGQLASVTRNGVVTTFGYDGLGRRVRKTVNGVTKYFLHDGDNLVLQLDANGNRELEFSYYPGVDQPHAVRRSSDGAMFYYTTELPGHVTGLVNSANQVVNSYSYTPFGTAIDSVEQVAQPFRFTGREYDRETGLYYYRARYYDPGVGRFISEDPIGLAGGINVYAYAGNDPLNATDPFGLSPMGCPEGYVWAMDQDDSGIEFYCAQQMEPVIIRAKGGGAPFSSNFGNPSARGGEWHRAGVSIGGRGTGSSNVSGDALRRIQSECGRAVLATTYSWGSDALTAGTLKAGVMAISKAGHFARLADQTSGALHSLHVWQSRVYYGSAVQAAQVTGGGVVDGLPLTLGEGPLRSMWSIVPIAGSIHQSLQAFDACGG